VRTPGGRSLHHKLLSPERFKRDPAETRRVADEKQQRAERLRSGLEAERKAKLEKVLNCLCRAETTNSIPNKNLFAQIRLKYLGDWLLFDNIAQDKSQERVCTQKICVLHMPAAETLS
jgi:hypothetical protein